MATVREVRDEQAKTLAELNKRNRDRFRPPALAKRNADGSIVGWQSGEKREVK